MPNILTTNRNAIYKYRAQIETNFKGDDSPLVIENLRFKSIVIDYFYKQFNFPLIYCTINLPDEWREKVVQNINTGTLIFSLQKYIENNGNSGLKIDVIREECTYFVSTDCAKTSETEVEGEKREDIGNDITIGLISVNHINMNKNVSECVIKKGSMSSIIYYLLKGHDILLEPLDNNPIVKNFVLPSINTLSKTIKYLNDFSTFYKTQYRFFIDFDAVYVMSTSGQGVKKKGEPCNLVKFVLHNYYDEAHMEGMDYAIKDNMYTIDCSGEFSVISDTSDSNKSYSAIGGITSKGDKNVQKTGLLDKKSPIKERTVNIRVPNNNAGYVDNMISEAANDAVGLTISKNKIDSSILTLNKQYRVDATEVYGEKYNGTYILNRKRELYLQEGEGLAMSVLVSLNKVAGKEED